MRKEVVIAGIIALIVLGFVAFSYFEGSQTLCTADVKICDDGTGVGRNPGNNCEFYVCPGEEVEAGTNDFWIVSLIILSILGIFDSGYLVWKHYTRKPMKCFMGKKECMQITESKWAKVFGIRNDQLGLVFYVLMLLGAVFLLNGYDVRIYLLVPAALALGLSLFLVYVQRFILKDYCFYCLMSSLINLLIFITLLMIK